MAKQTIVVVDDEAPARSAVTRLLQERGFTVYPLASGQEAIDLALKTPFDVLLTDFRMPDGLDGLTTIRAVRRINPQVVAIIMTGHNSIDLAVQSLNLGVHGFVVKPFTAFELTRTIEQAITKEQLVRENITMRALVDIFGTTQALIKADVSPEKLPNLAVELAIKEVNADQSWLFLADENMPGHVELELAAGATKEERLEPGSEPLPIQLQDVAIFKRDNAGLFEFLQKVARQAFEANHTIFYVDGEDAQVWEKGLVPAQQENCHLAVPLTSRGKARGVLLLERAGLDRTFSEIELQTTTILATQAALAIDNSRLFRRLAHIEATREADRLRAQFVATVSHELRTPLTYIKGYVTTLLRPDVNWKNETGTEYLNIISEECDKLLELIENILEVSKIEAGVLQVNPEPVQIVEVIERAVTEARRRNTDLVIETKYPPLETIPFVLADPQRITQVLRNLIHNAIKYTPQSPKKVVISLSEPYLAAAASPTQPGGQAEPDQKFIAVLVQDNGIGLSATDKPKVFQRFYRVQTEVTKQTPGTGLGLAICRGIVEAHNGSISVDSAGPSLGTTFSFSLPVADITSTLELD